MDRCAPWPAACRPGSPASRPKRSSSVSGSSSPADFEDLLILCVWSAPTLKPARGWCWSGSLPEAGDGLLRVARDLSPMEVAGRYLIDGGLVAGMRFAHGAR